VGGKLPITKLILIAPESTAILAALGLSATAITSRLTLVADRTALKAALAADEKAAGFVRLAALEPALRTLTWEGAAIVGVYRVASLADWPLRAELPVDATIPVEWLAGPLAYDPAAAWTLAAGGDILLDRGVSADAKRSSRGADSLFDGGFADITGTTCCSQFGVPRVAARYVSGGGRQRPDALTLPKRRSLDREPGVANAKEVASTQLRNDIHREPGAPSCTERGGNRFPFAG
jgi:hypothetical protein